MLLDFNGLYCLMFTKYHFIISNFEQYKSVLKTETLPKTDRVF